MPSKGGISLKNKVFQFGPFRLDPGNRLLLRGGTSIPLSPKTFDTLAYLVQENTRLVTRDELMKAIWPDSFVEDGNLTVNISLLRKALGELDDGSPYIETVPRKGYRFNAPVVTVEAEPAGIPIRFPDPRRAPESEPMPQPPRAQGRPVRFTNSGGVHWTPAAGDAGPTRSAAVPAASFTRWLMVASLFLVIAGVVAGWLLLRRPQSAQPFSQRRLTSFAPEMAVTAAAISSGGNFIAYANPGGLFIQVIATGETHTLQLPAPHFQVASISWFPDGAELLADGSSPGDASPSLWIVSVIGTSRPVELGPY
ncbi:MAG: winged helix-turn-helix domain-containing protein, partial [Terriglobia bacterium]